MHPLHLLDEGDLVMLELWNAWRQGHLPAAGGSGDQPALLMDYLRIMDAADATVARMWKQDGS